MIIFADVGVPDRKRLETSGLGQEGAAWDSLCYYFLANAFICNARKFPSSWHVCMC
jgi:hypothetical protein